MRFLAVLAVFTTSVALVPSPVPAQEERRPALDVPYVPTPENVVEQMLKLANLHKGDVLYDLGCGDGRIVVTAAKEYGIHGVGIDLNPERIKEARENARKAGVADRVTFRNEDLFKADIKPASVVTLYLLPSVNMRLRPRLWSDLKPGTRIVSHDFDMGEWKPEKTVEIEWRKIYFWTVPSTPPAVNDK